MIYRKVSRSKTPPPKAPLNHKSNGTTTTKTLLLIYNTNTRYTLKQQHRQQPQQQQCNITIEKVKKKKSETKKQEMKRNYEILLHSPRQIKKIKKCVQSAAGIIWYNTLKSLVVKKKVYLGSTTSEQTLKLNLSPYDDFLLYEKSMDFRVNVLLVKIL